MSWAHRLLIGAAFGLGVYAILPKRELPKRRKGIISPPHGPGTAVPGPTQRM